MKNLFLLTSCLTIFSVSVFSQSKLVDIKNIEYGAVQLQAFNLDSDQTVKLDAVTLSPGRMSYYEQSSVWILNAHTRELIWESADADFKSLSDNLSEIKSDIKLPKGTYEVYYSIVPSFNFNFSKWDNGRGKYHTATSVLKEIFSEIFDDDDEFSFGNYNGNWNNSSYLRNNRNKLYVSLTGKGTAVNSTVLSGIRTASKLNVIIDKTRVENDESMEQGFEVKSATDLEIYAIGEMRRDNSYDYGWIENSESGEKIWEFNYRNSEYAGGAEKNREVRNIISFKPGKYVLFFNTDDSHSYENWNEQPPYDPDFYGIMIKAKNEKEKSNISLYSYTENVNGNTIVNLTKVRDDEFESKGFTLSKSGKVRVIAYGEGTGHEMADYGWIMNADTRETVWQMKYRDTEHAGGAGKNRMSDEVIMLDKGNYIVNYVTDGSHAFNRWNAAKPSRPQDWGIRLILNDKNLTTTDVKPFDEKSNSNVIAQIVQVRDHARKKVSFTLDKTSKVRIYALGEGTGNEMHDYGWIEEANNGEIVWEMRYRKTENAGGAHKNRMVNTTLTLPAGEYLLFYESDDSHSFNDWNDTPPYDPTNWGITVSKAE